ncbi:hypothetical protein CSB07_00835 [Candidatus Gracilibacteria bacterium]|nr:MAG: hypothetical protein CSB07_00835 [Candidatus Gracilibacteria bacterium]PIE85005.1 MAG: hypothetical protein CSA08_04135 [Candidatus Gracilibacteria bacterium]
MYNKGFYINQNLGNNAFSFNKRENKKLFVPSLVKGSISDIKVGDKIAFEDYDFNDKLSSCKGLKNFYEINWNNKKIFLFDNHNHAYYFWYLARDIGLISDNNTLFHVDEHSDMRDPQKYLLKPDSQDMEKVFNYTNYEINVGNYIIPAIKEGIISNVIQIRNETNLNSYIDNFYNKEYKNNIILNLDLDFFQPDLDFIPYKLKKKVILDIAKKSKFITVATSPFFINQNLALKIFKKLFGLLKN